MADDGWQDATKLLAEGCAAIAKGDIVISPTIPLWDAMGAIKIGDARMDMGAEVPLSAGEDGRPNQTFDPTLLLLPAEVIEIMDRTLACEMTWHTGHSLSQTVYTSLYLHDLSVLQSLLPPSPMMFFPRPSSKTSSDPLRPPELSGLVLRAYMLGTAKSVEAAWEEIVKGNLLENEDINSNKCGLSLYEDVTIDEALALLDEAHDWLDAWHGEGSAGTRVALMERIRFRIEFLYCLSLFWSGPEALLSLPDHADSALSGLLASPPLPLPPSSLSLVDSAFDNSIARRLPTDMPPRPMTMLGVAEARGMAEGMVRDLVRVAEMTEGTCIVDWQMLFESFSRRSDGAPPYIRSLLVSCIFSNDTLALDTTGERKLAWLGRQYLREFTGLDADLLPLPPHLLQHVNLAAGNIVGWLVVLANNRPRARRKLAALIPQWRNLQSAAVALTAGGDERLQRLPLGAQYVLLSISIEVLFAGFDLDLYGRAEHRCMWWATSRLLMERRALAASVAEPTRSGAFLSVAGLDAAMKHLVFASLDSTFINGDSPTVPPEIARANYERRLKFLKVGPSDSRFELPGSPSLSFHDFLAWEADKSKQPTTQLEADRYENLASARELIHNVATADRDLGLLDTEIRSTAGALAAVWGRMQRQGDTPAPEAEVEQPSIRRRMLKWFIPDV